MADIIRAISELLRTVGEMAGGRIRGQIAFWVIFAVIAILSAKPAYDSMDYVIKQLGVVVGLPNLFVSLLVALMSTIMLVGLGFAGGAFLGLLIRLVFATPLNRRIDNIFVKLMPLLRDINKLETNNQNTTQLLSDAEKLYTQWNTSRINKFLRWGIKKRQTINKTTKIE